MATSKVGFTWKWLWESFVYELQAKTRQFSADTVFAYQAVIWDCQLSNRENKADTQHWKSVATKATDLRMKRWREKCVW